MRKLVIYSFSTILSGLLPTSAAALDAGEVAVYDRCLRTAVEDPDRAMLDGLSWYEAGGGLPARHCVAVALVRLRQFDEGASRLEKLAEEVGDGQTELRAGLLAQAAQAWELSGRVERALELQDLALAMRPRDLALRVDRALSRITLGQTWEAIDDLNVALDLAPSDPEILLYRASAYRYLDVLDLARVDVERALSLDPGRAEAWLERGILRQLDGDLDGAREDWLQAIELDPDGAAGAAARYRLQDMDVVGR